MKKVLSGEKERDGERGRKAQVNINGQRHRAVASAAPEILSSLLTGE